MKGHQNAIFEDCFSTQRNGKKTKTVLKEIYLKTKELGARNDEPGQWMISAV
jgi:hypothetical protein